MLRRGALSRGSLAKSNVNAWRGMRAEEDWSNPAIRHHDLLLASCNILSDMKQQVNQLKWRWSCDAQCLMCVQQAVLADVGAHLTHADIAKNNRYRRYL